MAKTNTMVTLGVIALLIIAVALAYPILFQTGQSALEGQVNAGTGGTYISTGATTISLNVIDALSQGTAVGGVSYIGVNGAVPKTSVTTASPTDTLEVLQVNGTNYHNAYLASHKVPTSPTDVITLSANKNATVTMTMFNTNQDVISNGVGTNNQSMSTGSSANMAIRFDGQDKTSTQDMVCILEASNNAKVDKLTLSMTGAVYKGMVKPSSYTMAGATSQVWVYDVAPVAGAVSVPGTIGVVSKSGQDASATYGKITCLSKEYFLDSATGKISYDIEDSLGTAKSMASYGYTFYFD